MLKLDLDGTRYRFRDMAHLLACASPVRSGDALAGLIAENEAERIAARYVLADLPLTKFLEDLVIPYEEDEITRLIIDNHDKTAFARISSLTRAESA